VPGIRIVGAAPDHAGCAGEFGGTLVEGIVEDVASCAGQGATPDEVVRVPDRDALAMTLRLAREEAILAGGSSGVAVCAAVRIARELGRGKRVVTLIPDTGRNYLSTYFNDEWRRVRGL
jgi:cystathionine beta-synthase